MINQRMTPLAKKLSAYFPQRCPEGMFLSWTRMRLQPKLSCYIANDRLHQTVVSYSMSKTTL